MTPMQHQYNKLKTKYKDCILLFRLGDFYEGFDEDAKVLSKVLGITLTSRRKGKDRSPMAGIPHHALHSYLPRLIKAGYKVAIADQLEKPQPGKKVVARDVVKVISSGTVMDERSLDDSTNNYLAAVHAVEEKKLKGWVWGLAFCDLTTGEFKLCEYFGKHGNTLPKKLTVELERLRPSELLVTEKTEEAERNGKEGGVVVQKREEDEFDFDTTYSNMCEHFDVKSLKGFGVEDFKVGISAAGAILAYLKETHPAQREQKSALSHISKISLYNTSDFMVVDETTIRNLELLQTIRSGDEKGSLLWVLNHCVTPMGKRLLRNWLLHPLIDVEEINKRLDGVEELFKFSKLDELRERLEEICDVERVLGRIGAESANARDLVVLKQSLLQLEPIVGLLKGSKSKMLKEIVKTVGKSKAVAKVVEIIDKSIADDPPLAITEGGIMKEGLNKEVDELREAMHGGKDWIRNLQAKEIKRTDIESLKVKFNKVFGYYIEVTKANLDKVPDDYVRKQTLVNAERFITPELKEMEEKVLGAEEKVVEIEYELFREVRAEIAKYIPELQEVAEAVAKLDVVGNLGNIARLNDYVRPKVATEKSRKISRKSQKGLIRIKDGRHPVVEQLSEEPFVPNDCLLDNDENQLIILTGPNMSGKSTFIRQVALLTLMAQIGSFIPAKEAEISVVDRIFTRVGASDELTRGESTFMVEMIEAANILNNATEQSLIILDEVGRGTSTYDGVAIAWAIAEFIHENIGAKTLFATHYHELVQLEEKFNRVKNYNVAVKEKKDKVIFLRKIVEGGTDRSYGVHVGQLAGLPQSVVKRAEEILLGLEQESLVDVKQIKADNKQMQTDLNRYEQMPLLQVEDHKIVKELKKLDPENMTPMEALKRLIKWKEEFDLELL